MSLTLSVWPYRFLYVTETVSTTLLFFVRHWHDQYSTTLVFLPVTETDSKTLVSLYATEHVTLVFLYVTDTVRPYCFCMSLKLSVWPYCVCTSLTRSVLHDLSVFACCWSCQYDLSVFVCHCNYQYDLLFCMSQKPSVWPNCFVCNWNINTTLLLYMSLKLSLPPYCVAEIVSTTFTPGTM